MFAGSIAAHRGHQGVCLVVIDEKTRDVRIAHVFSAHDLEPELVTIAPQAQPSVDDPDALKALIDHMATRFSVNRQSSKPLGHEFEADQLRFTYGLKLKSVRGPIKIAYDLFPYSTRHVTTRITIRFVPIKGPPVVKSLTFQPGDSPKSVVFIK